MSNLFFFFYLHYLESDFFYPQLTLQYLQQLIQPDLESRFIVRSQLDLSIQSGSSPSAGLQVVTQSTHLSKDCYPQLVSNPLCSEIRPPRQLGYRCMPLHPAQIQKYTFIKKNPLKCEFLRFLSDRVNICQIPHVSFEMTGQFLLQFFIILHCHDK